MRPMMKGPAETPDPFRGFCGDGGRALEARGDANVDVLLNTFHLYMCLGGFRLRSRQRVTEMVREAGFSDVRARVVLPVFMPMIVGTRA